ncbi:MAG: autotransporter-associated beta strand repeat-containing protein, partial [Paenalcaligenes sp.]
MNRIYKSLWSMALGAWVAVPETARTKSAGATQGGVVCATSRPVWRKHSLAIALAAIGGGITAAPVYAACTQSGVQVSCNGTTAGYISSGSNLTITVSPSAIVSPSMIEAAAIKLTGTGVSLDNNGHIGSETEPSSGVVIANMAGSSISVTNTGSGTITAASSSVGEHTALQIRNGAGGMTTVTNSGTIRSQSMAGGSTVAEDQIALSLGGGATNVVMNSGGITGRVELQASTSRGNTFTNTDTINGSVSLGTGGAANRFVAVTGSTIKNGNGGFFVDGGSANNGNTLALQNSVFGGSGTAGSGLIDGDKFLNFSKLEVSSGTWNVRGTLFSNSTLNPTSVELGGGLLLVSSGALGAATIQANGGSLGASSGGATLANNIELNSELTLAGSQNLTLTGVISGTGSLVKNGNSVLTLAGANRYSGTTTLSSGTLSLGNNTALGSGELEVSGAAKLDSSSPITLTNGIELKSELTLVGGRALTLSGAISGTGSLVKNGANVVTLAGVNYYSGTTTLNAGWLELGNNAALGAGALVVGGAAKLDSSSPIMLANNIGLKSELTLVGSQALTLAGAISGTGSLVKNGANVLTLSGVNSYSGTTTLNAGGLELGNNAALGAGALVVGGAAALYTEQAMSLANAIELNGILTLDGGSTTSRQDLTLSGEISGNGTLVKNAPGTLTLTGRSTYAGRTQISVGMLVVGSNTALGTGVLGLGAGTTLDSNSAVSLGNGVET